ncbi:MAG TPA: transcription antitermination factor NusB [Proteobacteria bacterium]|nr:hypothetical protein BMS3Abin14_01108 [bacterium BMS3Abin14]HDL52829.1 transcription antitermination factor NusB [Pseudomonadota bacterium]
MGSRRRAREIALQILYRLDANPCDPDLACEEMEGLSSMEPDARAFARDLVIGTMGSLEEIDRTISSASLKWDMKRMAAVDRNLLRLASFELMFQRETPARVVLNEAIEMAKSFGGEESGGFINGILDRVRYDMGRQD